MKKLVIAASIAALTSTANAALEMRGQNMVYDTVLDITWLLDANYAKTSGYDADGKMTWDAAKAWASQLTITDATYGTVKGWRLASARLQEPVNYKHSYDGSTDAGFNVKRSELGHMFFNNLKNKAFYDTNNNYQPNYGLKDNTYTDANGSIVFKNILNALYWNHEQNQVHSPNAWFFSFKQGSQGAASKSYTHFAWAVRDGDVSQQPSEVPVPAAAWLFGSALVGLVGLRRKK